MFARSIKSAGLLIKHLCMGVAIIGLAFTVYLEASTPVLANEKTGGVGIDKLRELTESIANSSKVDKFTLNNGLTVVVIPDHRAPIVTHMIWYKVGSADEPPGKSGIAHYLEHLMFKGTHKHPPGEFDQVVAENGGQQNAFTSYDYTGYYQKTAKEHLKLMMEYESDRMTNLKLTEDLAAPELQVVLEERATRVDNNPSAQLSESIQSTLYTNHPYSIPIIGWQNEIENLTIDDVFDFYNKHYVPGNAILVVAGDVTLEEVRSLAESTYGKVPAGVVPPERDRTKVQVPLADYEVRYRNDRVQQPVTQKNWIVPSELTAEGNEALALTVLARVLGGGTTSRLHKELVLEQQIAAYAGARYFGSRRDDTSFLAYASPRDDASLEDLQSAIRDEIELIVRDGIEEKELVRVKHSILASSIFSYDSHTRLARYYGSALTTGFSIEDVKDWSVRIQSVTSQDVQNVAEKYLTGQGSVIGHLLESTSPNGG